MEKGFYWVKATIDDNEDPSIASLGDFQDRKVWWICGSDEWCEFDELKPISGPLQPPPEVG